MQNRTLWIQSGVAGLVGFLCYIAVILIPWPETQLGVSVSLLSISAWPILSIVYFYGLYTYIARENDGPANRLAFVFAVVGFTTVLAMIIVQMSVGASVPEITKGLDETSARALRHGLRTIDLGLDVAWDMLIGVALVFSGIAMFRCPGLGRGWGLVSGVLGVALIILNAATFPTPPGNAGLFDIGPFIAGFELALAARLLHLGMRVPTASS